MWMPKYFRPPVREQRIPTSEKPFKFFRQLVAMSVVFRNGHYLEVRSPSQEETDQLVEGETWFPGGRSFQVSDDVALLLEADGFTVTTTGPIFGGG